MEKAAKGKRKEQDEVHLNLTLSFIKEFKKNKGAVLGLLIIFLYIFAGIFAPLLSPYDPFQMDFTNRLQPPGWDNLLGTDEHGRDILSRIIHGTRISIFIALVAVAIAGGVGGFLGIVAGFWPRVDTWVMRLVDFLMSFPFLLLAIIIVSILGPGLRNSIIAVGLAGIAGYARVTRSSVLKIREIEYVEAARALGCSNIRIIFVHIIPNIFAPFIVMVTLTLGTSLLGAASLSFLGLGAQPPQPEWGFMLNSARGFIRQAWWYSVFPGLAIMFFVLGFNMLGDGLRDALDPRLRNSP